MIDEEFHFSALYSELYSIPGLKFLSTAVSFKNAGVGFQVVNENDFYMNSINIGYSFDFGKELRIGISGELTQMFVRGESGVFNSFSLGAGFLIPYSSSLILGVALHNIIVTNKSLNGEGEIAFSSRLQVFKGLIVYFDAFYDVFSRMSYRFLTNYRIWKDLNLTVGLRSSPNCYYIGLSFQNFIKFIYIVALHPYLGFSHFVGLREGFF